MATLSLKIFEKIPVRAWRVVFFQYQAGLGRVFWVLPGISGIKGITQYFGLTEMSGTPKYRVIPYFGFPATRWFSKLNWVGSGIEWNTGYRVGFGYPQGTAAGTLLLSPFFDAIHFLLSTTKRIQYTHNLQNLKWRSCLHLLLQLHVRQWQHLGRVLLTIDWKFQKEISPITCPKITRGSNWLLEISQ